MDDADVLLARLYANPPQGTDRKKIDQAWNDYQLAKKRGQKASFSELLVRKRVLEAGVPEKLLAEEKGAFAKDEERVFKKQEPKREKPKDSERAKARTPSSPRTPQKTPPQKTRTPSDRGVPRVAPPEVATPATPSEPAAWKKTAIGVAALAALGVAIVLGGLRSKVGEVPPEKPPTNEGGGSGPFSYRRPVAPPTDGGASGLKSFEEDAAQRAIREAMNEAAEGDPALAEKKLSDAIEKASPEDKEKLERARWRLREQSKERKAIRELLDRAEKLAKEGKRDEAIEMLQAWLDTHPDDTSPEAQEVRDALFGVGRFGDFLAVGRLSKDGKRRPRKSDGPGSPISGSGGQGGEGPLVVVPGSKPSKPGDPTETSPAGGGTKPPAGSGPTVIAPTREEREKKRKERRDAEEAGDPVRGDDIVVDVTEGDDDDDDGGAPAKNPDKGRRPASESGGGGVLVATGDDPAPPKNQKKYRSGQRPVGESHDGVIVTGVLDEVDDEPEEEDGATRPEQLDKPVPQIPVVEPRPLEEDRALPIARVTSEGLVFLAKTKKWVDEKRATRASALADEAELAKKRSREKPFAELEVPGGLVLRDAVVQKYDRSGFLLSAKNGGWGSDWNRVPDIAIQVRKLGCQPDDPEDLMRLGRWCATRRWFGEARKAFDRAVSLDPRLRDKVPKLDLLEAGTRLFAGDVQRGADTLRVSYPWRSATELQDFFAKGPASVNRGKLWLERPAQLFSTKPIVFAGRFVAEVRLGAEPGGAMVGLGLRFKRYDEEKAKLIEEERILVYFGSNGMAGILDARTGKPLVAGRAGSRPTVLRFEATGDSLTATCGRFSGTVPLLAGRGAEVAPFLASNDAPVSIDELVLHGRVTREWQRKQFGGMDLALAQMATSEALGAPDFALTHEPPSLSAEIGTIDSLSSAALRNYEKGKSYAEKEGDGALARAITELSRTVVRSRAFGAGYYHRARCALRIGKLGPALHDLNRAVTATGGFAEAVAFRAHVLAQLRRFEEADRDVALALRWRPDSAIVRGYVGLVRFAEQRHAEARDELELACALDPLDTKEIADELHKVVRVLEGPGWEKPTRIETPRFIVESDLPAERVRDYANRLEVVRPFYESVVGFRLEPGTHVPKSNVLIFDSQEAYNSWNRTTYSMSHPEFTLGVFFGDTKQLVLFEPHGDSDGKNTVETLLHEGFHQYLDQFIDTRNSPRWANEGTAEYVGATRIENGVITGVGGLQRGRLASLLRYGKTWPFDEIMNAPATAFWDNLAPLRYAQAWTMIHFLIEGEGGRWKPLYRRYLEHCRAGRSPANAYNRTFGRVDMDALEASWRAHVKQLGKQLERESD